MSERPGESGDQPSGRRQDPEARGDDLERRRRELDAAIAARRPAVRRENGPDGPGGMSGFGNALKLSSEFVAGVVVGAGVGWMVDRFAGTSPFGLIVFLLLGFAAGVLNVLRSVGVVAEPLSKKSDAGKDSGGK